MVEFADRSPVPAPRPVGIGAPAHGYPMAWSIQTWVNGSTASPTAVADSERFAADLAALIAALRASPTRGRGFTGHSRGSDLRTHDDWVAACRQKSQHLLDVEALRRLWERLRVHAVLGVGDAQALVDHRGQGRCLGTESARHPGWTLARLRWLLDAVTVNDQSIASRVVAVTRDMQGFAPAEHSLDLAAERELRVAAHT